MVKVVGFTPPIDAAKLEPGSPFRFGDHEPPGYALVVKAGVKTMALTLDPITGQPAAPGYLPIHDITADCYEVEAEWVVTRNAKTKALDAYAHGALVFDGDNKPFIVIEQANPQPRLFVSLESGEAQATALGGQVRIFGGWSLTLESNGTVLAKLQT